MCKSYSVVDLTVTFKSGLAEPSLQCLESGLQDRESSLQDCESSLQDQSLGCRLYVAGISCPRASRPAPGGAGAVPSDPYGEEALAYTKDLTLQKEVFTHPTHLLTASTVIYLHMLYEYLVLKVYYSIRLVCTACTER